MDEGCGIIKGDWEPKLWEVALAFTEFMVITVFISSIVRRDMVERTRLREMYGAATMEMARHSYLHAYT